MAFVQELLTGEYQGESVFQDALYMTTNAPKTVTAGNSIVALMMKYGNNALGWPVIGPYDNLGNTYSIAYAYNGFSELDFAIVYANNITGGSLTTIDWYFGGVGQLVYHISGCSAEFEEEIVPSDFTSSRLTTAGTSITSATITLAESLLLVGVGVGNQDSGGGGSSFVPPSGFTLASSRVVSGTASSSFLCYKYGSLSNEALTASWSETKKAAILHGIGGAWTSPFTPHIYRRY